MAFNDAQQNPIPLKDFTILRGDSLSDIFPDQVNEFASFDQAKFLASALQEAGIENVGIKEDNPFPGTTIRYLHENAPRIFLVFGVATVPNDFDPTTGQTLPDHKVPVALSVGRQMQLHREKRGKSLGEDSGRFGDKLVWRELFNQRGHEIGEVPVTIDFDWSVKSGRV